MLFLVLAVAAAIPHPGQILAGSAFERFASYTDRACASRRLRWITPGDLDWEQETFEDQLRSYEKLRLASANREGVRCSQSKGGLACPTTATLDAMRRTGMLPAFSHFACTHLAPVVSLQEHVRRPVIINSSGIDKRQTSVVPPGAEATAILQHLDLNSFPNSTGPRRQPALRAPADYGLTRVETFDDGWAQVSEPDDGWHMSAQVLEVSPVSATLCFLDTGGNGASYRATQVLHVHLQADARWAAVQVADRADCRNDPAFHPGAQTTQDDGHGIPTFIPHHTMPPRQ